jgi:hypothetical protein
VCISLIAMSATSTPAFTARAALLELPSESVDLDGGLVAVPRKSFNTNGRYVFPEAPESLDERHVNARSN